jgi:hypothetical protein
MVRFYQNDHTNFVIPMSFIAWRRPDCFDADQTSRLIATVTDRLNLYAP